MKNVLQLTVYNRDTFGMDNKLNCFARIFHPFGFLSFALVFPFLSFQIYCVYIIETMFVNRNESDQQRVATKDNFMFLLCHCVSVYSTRSSHCFSCMEPVAQLVCDFSQHTKGK